MFYWICKILVFLPLLLLFPTKIIGKKNFPKRGKVIVCPNHQSNNDIVLLAYKFSRRFKFLAKESLFKNRFVGAVIKSWGAYPIKRGEIDIKAVKETLGYLKQEKAICIFPEGKRLTSDESNKLKGGVVFFSLKADAPVVPMFIYKKPRIFTRNVILIGEPFKFGDYEEFKNKKLDSELTELGSKILSQKIYDLKKNYEQSIIDKQRRK